MELSIDAQREQIALWIDRGAMLATVEEELIGPASVSEDERAALWLYAWSYALSPKTESRPVKLLS